VELCNENPSSAKFFGGKTSDEEEKVFPRQRTVSDWAKMVKSC